MFVLKFSKDFLSKVMLISFTRVEYRWLNVAGSTFSPNSPGHNAKAENKSMMNRYNR